MVTHALILRGDLADAAMVIRLRQCVARQQAARDRAWDAWAKNARRQYRIELLGERRALTRPPATDATPEWMWQEQWFSKGSTA